MAAPKGNKFWKLRSKHGRDKLFASPELLWEAACEYFEWCDSNPWEKTETTIKPHGIDIKTTPTERPYTIEGFCLYCDASRAWWREFKEANHKDFLLVTTRIDEIIYRQKFEGEAVGAFNANIIARDLGLTEKTNTELSGSIRTNELTPEEIDKRIEELKLKLNAE